MNIIFDDLDIMKLSLCLVFVMLVGTVCSQDYYFVDMTDNFPVSATAGNSMDVEFADVDGDADLDIIVANEYGRNLLLFNDGQGVFTEDPDRLFPEKNSNDNFSGEDSEDIAIADFDQDGDLDLLFVSEDTQYHELLINDGTGSFSFSDYDFPTSTANAVMVMDLNNDGYPDVIIGNSGQNQVYINNQDMTFSDETWDRWPLNTEWTQDLKPIDLDMDGDMDLIEGCDQGSNNAYVNTNGFFAEANDRLPELGTVETRKITIGDTWEGYPNDIFVSTVNWIGSADVSNLLFKDEGDGFYTDATSETIGIYDAFTLDALFYDVNGDGLHDLITTDFQNPQGNYHAYMQQDDGSYLEDTANVFEPFSLSLGVGLAKGDLNGDGYDDIYFANFQESDDLVFFDPAAASTFTRQFQIIEPYPNPTYGHINIKLPLSADKTQSVVIMDSTGRQVTPMPPIHNGSYGSDLLTFDITHLENGVYTVRLKQANTIWEGSFVKQ